MGHGSCDMTEAHGSWAMRCRARIYLPMGHGLRKGMPIPWIMSCARVCLSHGSWAVQGPISPWVMGHARVCLPMGHGLCKGLCIHGSWTMWGSIRPWVMDCARVCLSMGHVKTYSHILSIDYKYVYQYFYNKKASTYVALANSVLAIPIHLFHLSVSLAA